MKKHNGIKVTLIISIICVIIGAFCIGMGIVQNGDIAYLRVDNQTAPWWPFHGSFGIHLEEVAEDISKTKTFSQTFDDVDKLELNVAAVNTTIRVGDNNSLRFSNIYENQVSVSRSTNTMKVDVKNKHFLHKARLDITLKKEDLLKKLEIDASTGHLTVQGLRLKDLIVDGDATEVEMQKVQVSRKMELSAQAGSIDMKEMVSEHSEFDVQAGSIDVSGDLRGKSKIDCQAGSVNLYLQDKENQYGYQIKNEVGSVELGEQDYSGLSNEISVRNDAKNQLDIDCQAGSVEIAFDHA